MQLEWRKSEQWSCSVFFAIDATLSCHASRCASQAYEISARTNWGDCDVR